MSSLLKLGSLICGRPFLTFPTCFNRSACLKSIQTCSVRSVQTQFCLLRSVQTQARSVRSVQTQARSVRSVQTQFRLLRSVQTQARSVRSIQTQARSVRSVQTPSRSMQGHTADSILIYDISSKYNNVVLKMGKMILGMGIFCLCVSVYTTVLIWAGFQEPIPLRTLFTYKTSPKQEEKEESEVKYREQIEQFLSLSGMTKVKEAIEQLLAFEKVQQLKSFLDKYEFSLLLFYLTAIVFLMGYVWPKIIRSIYLRPDHDFGILTFRAYGLSRSGKNSIYTRVKKENFHMNRKFSVLKVPGYRWPFYLKVSPSFIKEPELMVYLQDMHKDGYQFDKIALEQITNDSQASQKSWSTEIRQAPRQTQPKRASVRKG